MKSFLTITARCAVTLIFACLVFCVQLTPAQEKMDAVAKGQAMDMLRNVKKAIRDDYYDPAYGGMDLDQRFKTAEDKLKGAEYLGQAFSIIAQAVIDLNDSHTRFFPPSLNSITEYGWRMKIIRNEAYITAVKEGSDAAAKGLKVGDEVLKLNGFQPTRREMWKMIYYYQTLSPKSKVTLDVKSPTGEVRQLEVESKVTLLKRVVNLNNNIDMTEAAREADKIKNEHFFREVGNTLIWKMPNFVFDPAEVDGIMGRTRGKDTLILDLRGNGGGYVDTLEELAGYVFEKNTKIADLKGRKKMDPQNAKSKGSKVFKGKIVVLIDSNSASAAEIFARLMQIEKRGVVLGDVSAGAVMQSQGKFLDAGVENKIGYGMNLTMADVIMTDGKSLEHVGVTPDLLITPTASDLAARRDPVLAAALELVGLKVDSAMAGKMFPVEKFVERQSHVIVHLDF